ncbi:hypothetical protein LXL04_024643 [Taraxacum kok-saghyz]
MSVMLKDYYDSMERVQNSADLEEGLTHMENEILVDEMERRTAEVSSYSNTDVDEEYISDTQEARNENFTSTSSNITPLQDSNPDEEGHTDTTIVSDLAFVVDGYTALLLLP